MTNDSEILVRLGDMAISSDGRVLVALGLGSCVAVILDDRSTKISGLAHVLLPSRAMSRDRGNPARSADTAVPRLVGFMCERGASRSRLTGRLVGGANMFADLLAAGTVHIGERNIEACRRGLNEASIKIVGEAVGGQQSRSVWVDSADGTVTVRMVGGVRTEL